MTNSIIKLSIAAFLPVAAATFIYLFEKYTDVDKKMNKFLRQVIIGIIFGGLAIVGTEWGIPLGGAQVNARDAAVLVSGLFFGGPAGIIAGLIGGIERWVAVAWGVGSFTRVACSVSTIIAGFYSAALRKFMFENKKPSWLFAFAIGFVMEVFHLTMVFVTNMSDPDRAIAVVEVCTPPMLIANSLSVLFTGIAFTLISGELFRKKNEHIRITTIVQRWLLITVFFAFLVTSIFVFRLQDSIAKSQTLNTLSTAATDVAADIRDASDRNLLNKAYEVQDVVYSENLSDILIEHNLAEISLVNKDGIIFKSTDSAYVNFDMHSGEQSKAFLCLLEGEKEYIQEYGSITSDNTIKRKYAGIKTDYGFLQVGYDAEHLQKDIDEQVIHITENRHVGRTGYMLITNDNLDIVSGPVELKNIELKNKEMPAEGEVFELIVDGVETYALLDGSTEGYTIVSILPKTEALQDRNTAIYVNGFLEVLVFAVLFALIYMLIKQVVVDRIDEINSSLAKITDGDLDVVVDVHSNEEFASLSDDINRTVDTLKRYIAEASARIDAELEFAKNIQASALPSVFPAFPKRKEIDIFASMNPAKEVGGDFYDFYFTHMNTFNFLIADVSGKGIPAAMFMMRAKTELKSLTESDVPLSDVFTRGNAALCEGNDAGMFVTAWQASIDLKTGLLTYANAGHNPPLVKHGDGKFEYVKGRPGFVLAGMDGVKYKTQEIELQPGDVVYVYTDGVTEATDASEELYGEDRLFEAINSQEFENVQALCKYIKADVDKFVGEAPQFDDITMVAFKYIGMPDIPTIRFEEATIDDITAVTEFVEEQFEKKGIDRKITIQMNIAIDEIYSNIVKYGYADKKGPVQVEIVEKLEPHGICIKFTDNASPYNPLMKEDPDVTLSAEERSIGGLGIFMVKQTMDDVKYRYEHGQNVLTIIKNLE